MFHRFEIILWLYLSEISDSLRHPISKGKVFVMMVFVLCKVYPSSARIPDFSVQKKPIKPSISAKKAPAVQKQRSSPGKKKTPALTAVKPLITALRTVEVTDGIRYQHLRTRENLSVHVLEVDRSKSTAGIKLLKGQERFNGLERLPDIVSRGDSMVKGTLKAAINANFWSYRKTPIGPTVIDGEVIQMTRYKNWSSCFFDRNHKMMIERFILSGVFRIRGGTWHDIQSVNERKNPEGIVLYNRFIGSSVPYSTTQSVESLEQEFLDTMDSLDESDHPVSREALSRTEREEKHRVLLEIPTVKIIARYNKPPAVNEEIPCTIIAVDSGVVTMPDNGFVLSLGQHYTLKTLPKPGDKLTLLFSTNIASRTPFINAVSGTPRLVRNGVAAHEAAKEGVRGRRFINRRLRRTAIGTNEQQTKLFLAVVDGSDKKRGASLQELAICMKQIGAYQAMNLDGGGSSTMLVLDNARSVVGNVETRRKIAVALSVITLDPPTKPTAKQIKPQSGTKSSQDQP